MKISFSFSIHVPTCEFTLAFTSSKLPSAPYLPNSVICPLVIINYRWPGPIVATSRKMTWLPILQVKCLSSYPKWHPSSHLNPHCLPWTTSSNGYISHRSHHSPPLKRLSPEMLYRWRIIFWQLVKGKKENNYLKDASNCVWVPNSLPSRFEKAPLWALLSEIQYRLIEL